MIAYRVVRENESVLVQRLTPEGWQTEVQLRKSDFVRGFTGKMVKVAVASDAEILNSVFSRNSSLEVEHA